MRLLTTLKFWAGGVRLYIGIGIVLLSLQAWWWAEEAYIGDPDLITSRLHEAYGWLSLLFLASALAIGPAYKLAPKLPGKSVMRDARRLIGVGAAWFATLHVAIAYFVSFKAINPTNIVEPYSRAFLLGVLALLCLWALAFTSFDAAFKGMGIWWFRLHRLIYAAVGLAVWHAFSIGVHATSLTALGIIISVALVLFITHVHVALQQAGRVTEWQILTLIGIFVLLVILSNYGIQQYIDANSLQGHH
jgi:DMSO/TMAO reductase YedYZ heme-binding membrane subunit